MAVLKEGSKAPAFKAPDQNGNMVSLSDFKGKKLILYFTVSPQSDLRVEKGAKHSFLLY